jgi:hypothetical protein
MERLAAITGAALARDMIALFLAKLANCANVRAVASTSSSDRLLDMRTAAIAAAS